MTLLRRMIDELRVTSCVNHHFDNVGFGEASIAIHADNCTSQNNNNFLLAYIIWRILTERNRSVKFCFRQPHKHHKGVVHVCMWVYCKRVWINLLNSIAYLWSLFSALVTRTQLYSPVALSCCLCCNLIPAVLYTGLWHVVQLPSKSNTDPLIIRKRTETSSRTAVISTFEKKTTAMLDNNDAIVDDLALCGTSAKSFEKPALKRSRMWKFVHRIHSRQTLELWHTADQILHSTSKRQPLAGRLHQLFSLHYIDEGFTIIYRNWWSRSKSMESDWMLFLSQSVNAICQDNWLNMLWRRLWKIMTVIWMIWRLNSLSSTSKESTIVHRLRGSHCCCYNWYDSHKGGSLNTYFQLAANNVDHNMATLSGHNTFMVCPCV